MKKIILIGASGFVGSTILNEALNRGIQVTAIVRDPTKITNSNSNLKVIKADVSSADTVTKIAKGADAVISAYNPGWANPNIYTETLKTYPIILNGVKQAGIKRLLIVGGAGTLYATPGVRVIDSGMIDKEAIDGVKSLGEFYLNTLMNEKEIDWVFFSPAGSLVQGERTGIYRTGKDNLIVNYKGESTISVQDYAKAMIDELEKPMHHQERFTIGY